MNIAYILPEFVTEKEAGGLATYYDNISRMFADRGHSITIFVGSYCDEIIEYYSNIRVVRVDINHDNIPYNIPGSYIRHSSLTLKEALENEIKKGNKFDLVQYPNFMGYGLDRLDIPTVIRVSSYRPYLRVADKELFDPDIKYTSIKIPDFIEDIAVIKADAVYGPSKLIADCIFEQTNKKVSVIESPFYPRGEVDGILSEKYTELENKKYILTFGSLKALKGAKVIGDVIYKVLDKYKDLNWIFAGAEMAWLNQQGKKVFPSEYISQKAGKYVDRIKFLGKVQHDDLLSIIKNADICVMPSRIDNLPNTCIEAMALKKIVIGTIGASFEQLLDDGISGYLVKREDSVDLYKAICKTQSLSLEEKQLIGEKAQDRIKNMSPDIIYNKLIEFYKGVIANRLTLKEVENEKYIQIVKRHNELLKECNEKDYIKYVL